MLTTRGFWFFLIIFSALAASMVGGAIQMILVCLALLLWFLVEWFLFQLRIRVCKGHLHCKRSLRTPRGPVETIWARQTIEIVLDLRNEGMLGFPYIILTDRLPPLAKLKKGTLRIDGPLTAAQPMVLHYQVECVATGWLRFEGIKIQLADRQGFFTSTLFLREPRTYRVLPQLAGDIAHATLTKQSNVIPLLGAHRHARPGTSSELHDLRDYLPGDPPRMIAWKVSARRDRLITKEFESEVPIRCTLYVDTSSSVRVGPAGETALSRLIEIAAAIAQANAAERDLTGLCLFDETGVQETIAPGRGSRHVLKILKGLTRSAGLAPHTPHIRLRELLPFAYGLVQDVYPDWLDREVNHFPFWLPLWSPQPYYAIPQPAIRSGAWWSTPWIWLRRRLRHSIFTLQQRRGSRFSISYHREYRWRKEIAAILAVRYQRGPGGLALLLEDDQLCVELVQRFLADHQVAYPYPLYDEEGNYFFALPHKAKVLAQALLRDITHGKDNELFVLCVDLLELSDQMDVLERAVCVARARHHKVVVICPWPSAVDPPNQKPSPDATIEALSTLDLHRLLLRSSTTRLHHAYAQMRRAFGRLGVPIICAAQNDTVDWILHRMRQLRIQERGVR